jgi:hypothetical protein
LYLGQGQHGFDWIVFSQVPTVEVIYHNYDKRLYASAREWRITIVFSAVARSLTITLARGKERKK